MMIPISSLLAPQEVTPKSIHVKLDDDDDLSGSIGILGGVWMGILTSGIMSVWMMG